VSKFVKLDRVFEELRRQHLDLQVLEAFLEDEPPVLRDSRLIGTGDCVFKVLRTWSDSEGNSYLEFAKSPATSAKFGFLAFLYFRVATGAPADTPATLVAYTTSHLNGKALISSSHITAGQCLNSTAN